MLKDIQIKIQKLEKQKEIKVLKQQDLQNQVNDIDLKLKKLQGLKKNYEKLEKSSSEFLGQL